MAELSELYSWNTSPTRFIAIIDGAESGLIETARICPTVSSCGTTTFKTAMIPIQMRMIGTASTRIIRGMNGLAECLAGGKASVGASLVGVLMRT